MPISFKARPPKTFGQIIAVEEVEGNFGTQNRITLKQANPEALSDRLLFFPQSDEQKSKWMRFLKSLSQFIGDITSVDDMLMKWIEVTDVEGKAFKGQDGEEHTPVNQLVTAVFSNEAECRAAWEAYRGEKPEGLAIPKADAKPVAVIDPALIPMLQGTYKAMNGDDNAFKSAVKGYGLDPEAALKAVKG